MARKSKSNPTLLIVATVIGFILLVPPEAWIALGGIGVLVLGYWWLNKNNAQKRQRPPEREQNVASNRKHAGARGGSAPARNSSEQAFATFSLDRNGRTSTEYRIPEAPADMAGARWIPEGKSVEVGPFTLPGGMLYVGMQERNTYGPTEPSLINPRLKVSGYEVDGSESLTSYWPNYADISPDARRAYLQWLADGRRTPNINIGYVFLFFYGLERRILVDLARDASIKSEIPAIASEVRRLLEIYADNYSFKRYARHFLDYLEADQATPTIPLGPPPDLHGRIYELPLKLKLGLGQLAVTQNPVPADWALTWAQCDPNIRRRTPTQRCKREFEQLFVRHYAESHGEGLVLKRNRTKLKFEYHPASNALGAYQFRRDLGDLPDVSAVRTPIQKLQTLVDECTSALEPYSRFIGRNPDKAHALEGLLQLPVDLWPASTKAELDHLKQRVSDGMIIMSFGELSGLLKSAGPLSRDKVLGLCRALESLNLGMEPDVLSGRKPPKAEDQIALFATHPEDGNVRSAPAYQAAAVTLDLACMALYADGEVSAHELVALTRQIDTWTHLSAAHRKRLKAHLRLGIDQPLTLASVKKKLEPLATEARRSIARLLAHLAQADGVVTPAEVKFLERAYKSLGLDTQLVYSDLHAHDPAGSNNEPTTTGHLVQKLAAATMGFTLDPNRIAQLERETAEVSALLAGVFVEDSPSEVIEPEDMPVAENDQEETGILGLGPEDSAFLRILVTRSSWSRSELADVAADMELMLDGTLEHINSAAFDAIDDPLTEGDDPIEVNHEALEALPV